MIGEQMKLDVTQCIDIDASVEEAFDALLRRLTSENSTPDNKAMPMVLEPWPGGRWYRDLGDQQGHLWGFVQVLKAPQLIEIQGPMFMSYPVAGHLQLRLTETVGGCELQLRHQVLGDVAEEHRQGLHIGWDHFLKGVQVMAVTNE